MSPFLEGVRVIDILAQTGRPKLASDSTSREDQPSPLPSPSASPRDRRQLSHGEEYLAVPICAIVFTFIYLIIKAIMAPFTQRAKYARATPQGGGGLTQEEIAVLQKLQRTLSQMESRVEALETILIDQARTEKNYGPKL